MAIETTGSFKGNTFKTSQGALAGGFVKNDGAGLFSYDEGPPAAAPDGSVWDHIQTQTIGGPDTDSVVFTGLDGDVDDVYKLVFNGVDYPSVVTTNYQLRPNGVVPAGPAFVSQAMRIRTSVVDNTTFTFGYWFLANSANFYFSGRVYIDAKTGQHRQYQAVLQQSRQAVSDVVVTRGTGYWTDTATNITSLEINTPSGNGITTGSIWSLWRINR